MASTNEPESTGYEAWRWKKTGGSAVERTFLLLTLLSLAGTKLLKPPVAPVLPECTGDVGKCELPVSSRADK